MKCTCCRQDGHFAIKCFKNSQGDSYKGKLVSSTGGKKLQFNVMNAAEVEEFRQFHAWRESQENNGYNLP